MDREETTLKGTYDNGSTFEYHGDKSPRAKLLGKMKESSVKNPTVFSIVMQLQHSSQATKEGLTLAAIKEIVGALTSTPLEAKGPVADGEKWDD